MKHLKSCAAAVLALLAADAAFAATQYVKITGSSAFRASTVTAVYNLLDSTQPITGGFVEAGKGMTGANRSILKGRLASNPTGDDYVIQMAWTGSVGGVLNVANDQDVSSTSFTSAAAWVSETSTLAAVTNSGVSGAADQVLTGTVITNLSFETAGKADIAMSDTKQSTTAFSEDAGFPNLNEVKVGVIPFVWVRGSSADSAVASKLAGFTNIGTLQAQQLLVGGLPLSQVTGLAADSDVKVFPLGRDADSGTRVVTFAETGFGVFSNPAQYLPAFTSGQISSIALHPVQTILGTIYALGQGGYASGGTLAGDLGKLANSTVTFGGKKVVLAGYMGVNDAVTALKTGNCSLLSWNGSSLPVTVVGSVAAGTYTFNFDNIKNGTYTFWSYEYVMQNPIHQFTGNEQDNFTTALIAQLVDNNDARVSGIALSEMVVSRNNEGAKIF